MAESGSPRWTARHTRTVVVLVVLVVLVLAVSPWG
jgi:hypothetical protein